MAIPAIHVAGIHVAHADQAIVAHVDQVVAAHVGLVVDHTDQLVDHADQVVVLHADKVVMTKAMHILQSVIHAAQYHPAPLGAQLIHPTAHQHNANPMHLLDVQVAAANKGVDVP